MKKFTDNIDKKFKSFLRYGIHKGEHTELKKLEGGNKQGSISLKDSSEMVAGTGHTTLLGLKETSDILQNKTMRIPCDRDKGVIIEFENPDKAWNTLCQAD